MSTFEATAYAFGSQVHEQEVGERVDDLGSVLRDHIILVRI